MSVPWSLSGGVTTSELDVVATADEVVDPGAGGALVALVVGGSDFEELSRTTRITMATSTAAAAPPMTANVVLLGPVRV
jgi:hypothetical protein